MRCKYIIGLAMFAEGEDNDEIEANVTSLAKKYGARPETTFYEVRAAKSATPAAQLQEIAAAIQAAPGSVGIYLLCHGGAETMKPSAEKLAAWVARYVFDVGIPLNKINLAACKSAGGKFHQGTFAKSSVHIFCAELQRLAGQGVLPDGLAVCAYNVNITTFDPEAPIFLHKYHKVPREGFDEKVGPVHSATMTYSGRELTQLTITHPSVTAGGAALTQALSGALAESEAAAWQAVKGGFGKAGQHPSFVAAALAAAPLKEAHIQKYEAQVVKQLVQRVNGAPDPALRSAMERYVQEKIVLVYNATTSQFSVGSLASYTDNAILRDLVSAIEVTSLREHRPSLKLSFHA